MEDEFNAVPLYFAITAPTTTALIIAVTGLLCASLLFSVSSSKFSRLS